MFCDQRIIVVMPAYDAAKTLQQTHAETLKHAFVDLIIIVDDASQDNTAALAQTLPRTKLITHPINRGYGANQKTCYAAALAEGADIVVMLHPDYQYPPALISELVTPLAQAQAACSLGSRMLGNLARAGGMPAWKRAANRFLSAVSNCLLEANLSEFHTGFRAFTAKLLRRLPIQQNSDDFLFDHQILAQILWLKEKIVEIPCPARYFPEASVITLPRAIKYGLGCIATDIAFKAAAKKWIPPPDFLRFQQESDRQ